MAPRKKKSVPDKTAPVINTGSYNYGKVKVKDADGKSRTSRGNGDAVATAMLGLSHDELLKVMKKNGLTDKLGDKPGKVNNGQFRMLLGNSLRALVRGGTPVDINGVEVKSLVQRVKLPDGAERSVAA